MIRLSLLMLTILIVAECQRVGVLLKTQNMERIVGGRSTTIKQHPYQAAMENYENLFCGCTVIAPHTILTAAHCCVAVELGTTRVRYLSTARAAGGSTVEVTSFVSHEDYNPETMQNDICILTVKNPINTTYAKMPLNSNVGSKVRVTGWGTLKPGVYDLPDNLQVVDIPCVSNEFCQEKYEPAEITSKMFCAGYKDGGKDSCQGDSGGPAMQIDDESRGTGYMAGVISFGNGCAEADYPGVYCKVYEYLQWIKDNKYKTDVLS